MKLILATSNVHKVTELRNMLPTSYELLGIDDVNITGPIPETGTTFTQNALQKARFVHNRCNLNCLADDSGLEVEALNGAPGVFTARYAGVDASSEDNINKLLKELGESRNRKARFVAVLALILDGTEHIFEGFCEGAIALSSKGVKGFGYDPVFIPDGYNSTFADLDPLVKNKISHRGMAIRKLLDFINTLPV